MAAPATLTITMRDSGPTTVSLAIPSSLTASQFLTSLVIAGGTWDKPSDVLVGATWWPVANWDKVVTS